jgi:hypothetical protein
VNFSDDDLRTCAICGLELELVDDVVDGHPGIRLTCLLHGERWVWNPLAGSEDDPAVSE